MGKVIIALFAICVLLSCEVEEKRDRLKISLAEWSLHDNLQKGEIDHLDFVRIAADSFQIHQVEYVSQFFQDMAEDNDYLQQMKDSCRKHNVESLLIMVDNEGNLGDTIPEMREEAVKNHKKWIAAASFLECSAIRVNGNGFGSKEDVQSALILSLKELCELALPSGIDVLVENHGMDIPGSGWTNDAPSANGKWLAEALSRVERSNCGALPDFGNFYNYDRYQGIKDLLPYAKGISAKSFDFDEKGEDKATSFSRMFEIIGKSDFDGYVGVEYEGGETKELTEFEGIRKTISLIKKYYYPN